MNSPPPTLHLAGIAGSLRAASFNRAWLRLVQRVLPEHATLDILDIGDIPSYDLDVEHEGFPEPVLRFREQIAEADGLLIATPEYNFSIPGVLKNAIDWASRHADSPLNHKVTAIAGVAGGSGSQRAQNHLRTVLGHNRMRVMARPEFFVAGGSRHFEDGEPIEEAFVEQTAEFAGAFLAFIERMRGVPHLEPGTILIVGRNHEELRHTQDRLGEYGMRAITTQGDLEALHAIEHRGIAALVIAGGVDARSQGLLEAALAQHRPDSPLVEIVRPEEAAAAVIEALGLF